MDWKRQLLARAADVFGVAPGVPRQLFLPIATTIFAG
jgi:hypothetical protein